MTINQTAVDTLVAKWAQPDGIPFKGLLISDDGCMCAQGQALHYVGGWDFERLKSVQQEDADKETAKLLGISVAHAILLRRINDGQPGAPSVVLTNPEAVLGDQAPTILAFWHHLDRMTADDWLKAAAARAAARAAAWAAAGDAAWAAARTSSEIQGAAIMRERGQPFFFLPMFGFADPEAVLAANQ